MDKQQTAYCMSAVAFADIVGRLTLPAVQDMYKIKARMMLILTSIWLIIVRQGKKRLFLFIKIFGYSRQKRYR